MVQSVSVQTKSFGPKTIIEALFVVVVSVGIVMSELKTDPTCTRRIYYCF